MNQNNLFRGSKFGITYPFQLSLICLVLLISSCNSPDATKDESKKNDSTQMKVDSDRVAIQSPPPSATFYSLKLTKTNYNLLKGSPGSLLVLQFYYPSTLTGNSPTLVAFAMKGHHLAIDPTKPNSYRQILDYNVPSAEPISGREQCLGDQQALISDMERIKDDSNDKPEEYQYFLFAPHYDPVNKHIFYNVSVYPTTIAHLHQNFDLDPSPPYSAR